MVLCKERSVHCTFYSGSRQITTVRGKRIGGGSRAPLVFEAVDELAEVVDFFLEAVAPVAQLGEALAVRTVVFLLAARERRARILQVGDDADERIAVDDVARRCRSPEGRLERVGLHRRRAGQRRRRRALVVAAAVLGRVLGSDVAAAPRCITF